MVASIHPAVTVNKDLGEHESAEKKTLTENFGLGGSTAGLIRGMKQSSLLSPWTFTFQLIPK